MNSIFGYRKVIAFLFCSLFLFLFLLFEWMFQQSGFWLQFTNWSPAYTYTCESQNLDGAIRQPLNTFSNLLLLFFGVEVIIFSFKDRQVYKNSPNLVRMNYQYSLVFGLCLVMLCVCSSFYHASMLDFFSQLDMAGVYSCVLFPLIITIHKIIAAKWFGNKPYFSYWGSLIAIASFLFSLFFLTYNFWQDEVFIILPTLFAILVGLSVYHARNFVESYRKDYLLLSGLFLFSALPCYMLDWYFCSAHSYFQFHSFWHIFAAFALYYYYLYLRSEKNLILKKAKQ